LGRESTFPPYALVLVLTTTPQLDNLCEHTETNADYGRKRRGAAQRASYWVGVSPQLILLLHSLSLYSVAAAGEVVTLCIGPDRKLYYVHKQLLCHHSGYFRAAYNGSWKEAEDGITLDFVEPEVFNIFLY
jgi:hypothetical protein